MSEEEKTASLRALTNDSRFAAVINLLREQKDEAGDSSAQLKFADHHGLLAHAAGVRYCALELEGKLRELCDPPKKRGAQPPPEITRAVQRPGSGRPGQWCSIADRDAIPALPAAGLLEEC